MKPYRAAFCGAILMVVLVLLRGCSGISQQDQEDQHTSSPSSSSSSCVNQLLPCLNYVNGNGDQLPDSCCDPLKSMIKSNPQCLCNMISLKGTNEAERAGINVTQAQQLPARCGQHVNPISCLTSSPSDSKNSVPNSARRRRLYHQSMTMTVLALTFFTIFQAAICSAAGL